MQYFYDFLICNYYPGKDYPSATNVGIIVNARPVSGTGMEAVPSGKLTVSNFVERVGLFATLSDQNGGGGTIW